MAIGIPLLLPGGCAAVVLVFAPSGRDAVVTEADPGRGAVLPSSQPPAEQAQEQPKQQPSTATVGGSITLEGMDPGPKVAVTVDQFINPATPAEDPESVKSVKFQYGLDSGFADQKGEWTLD
ncbi:hypothetical protein GCM10022224_056300 [Nonomuraea antimicrobica]|uniref:Uncharacterized protein n=1 Tax=Nonomuraea antimicrobica TaxID=561173 RepID=A0ABP7CC58_9ACTN